MSEADHSLERKNGNGHSVDYLEQLESLEIPANIDPRLLALWLQRERADIERRQDESKPKRKIHRQKSRKLDRLFATFISVTVMCIVIVLGLVQGREPNEILSLACQVFLFYLVIGFVVGCIAEYCVTDSVETLLREIVARSDQAAAPSDDTTEHRLQKGESWQ